MTQRQILLHYDAELRRIRHDRADRLVDLNLAFSGGKAAKAHVEALRK